MKISVAKTAFLLLARPDRFKQIVAEYSADQTKERQNRARDEAPFYLQQTVLIRRSLFVAFLIVVTAVVAGWLTGVVSAQCLGPAPRSALLSIQYLGIGILLLGTLGKRGKDIQTIGGVSLPERVDEFIYRVLYFTGSYLLVWSTTWPLYRP